MMRFLKLGLIVVAAIIGIVFLAPAYPKLPVETKETILALGVSGSGDRLLLQTPAYDFDFALPANQLNELSSPRFEPLRALGGAHVYLDRIRLQQADTATSAITIMVGGYDPRLSDAKSILPENIRADLADLGFVPSNGNVAGDVAVPLYMVWSGTLSGQAYAAKTREPHTGIDLTTSAVAKVPVVTGDEETTQHNRQINAMLAPLTDIRETVETAVFALLQMVTGATPSADG
jgi:hypothetical protein